MPIKITSSYPDYGAHGKRLPSATDYLLYRHDRRSVKGKSIRGILPQKPPWSGYALGFSRMGDDHSPRRAMGGRRLRGEIDA
ncbi:hypothetical protein M1O52_04425 [Dehalococcoidia bacterium]|nr:hypothetical protein [Dehalococcoidia bacterium]